MPANSSTTSSTSWDRAGASSVNRFGSPAPLGVPGTADSPGRMARHPLGLPAPPLSVAARLLDSLSALILAAFTRKQHAVLHTATHPGGAGNPDAVRCSGTGSQVPTAVPFSRTDPVSPASPALGPPRSRPPPPQRRRIESLDAPARTPGPAISYSVAPPSWRRNRSDS